MRAAPGYGSEGKEKGKAYWADGKRRPGGLRLVRGKEKKEERK